MSANNRLERLLYVLPRAAQENGVHIEDLARALDVEPADILADIEEATARVFYHPAGMVDSFNLSVEGDIVRLYGGEFNRPVRLSESEAMALGLGLRVLAAEADLQRRTEILALAHKLEDQLVAPTVELQPLSRSRVLDDVAMMDAVHEPAPIEIEFGEDDFRGDIAEAIDTRVFCNVLYLKADGSGSAERRIAPVRLMYTRGHWYVRAYERETAQHRTYRLDRILNLRRTEEKHTFEDAPITEPTFSTDGGQRVKVRYSKDIARWVAEREDAQCEKDGSLVIEHDVVDMNWLVRHVLQYGGEAVVETPGARAAVAKAVGDAASA